MNLVKPLTYPNGEVYLLLGISNRTCFTRLDPKSPRYDPASQPTIILSVHSIGYRSHEVETMRHSSEENNE